MIEGALEAVGLRPELTLGRFPHQLSGGQRQRIMVARTLLLRPKVIVADEPVSMIDASLRVTVLANLLQLKREYGISLIYITHDLATAYQISDRIIVLYRGEVVEEGDPEQIVKHPQHPYTKLLIGSIPLPDPKRRWGDTLPDENGFATPESTPPTLSRLRNRSTTIRRPTRPPQSRRDFVGLSPGCNPGVTRQVDTGKEAHPAPRSRNANPAKTEDRHEVEAHLVNSPDRRSPRHRHRPDGFRPDTEAQREEILKIAINGPIQDPTNMNMT